MKLKFNILSIATAAMLGAGLSSCNDWLRVDMEDQVMESTLFSDYKGFRTALNGIYISMISQYTGTFGPANLDVMAQCWNVSKANSHAQANWAEFRYGESSIEQANSNIWNGFYNLLANLNVIIEHTEDDDCPLSGKQYALMRGESLGLRAMFHFDLLRLYGPVFAISDQLECMPYQASSKREILPLLKACDVLDLIIKDLDEAAELLKGNDPIITEGSLLEEIVNNGISTYDDSFRQFRMNYYAVQALRARAYLWKGDKNTAYQIAKNDIIDAISTEDLTVFPWITKEAVVTEGKPDLVFSTEVMFSLYDSKRTNEFYNTYFIGSLNRATRLTFFGEDLQYNSKVSSLYESGDIRLNQWVVQEPSDSEKQEAEQVGSVAPNSLAFLKYSPIETGTSTTGMEYFRYMVPLVRLSEVYLIAAEGAPSNAEAFELINTLRAHRYIPDADPTASVDDLIFKEMYRETVGEGQIYFFYKRKAMTTMLSGTEADGIFEMALDNYVMPIPEDELAQRETNGVTNSDKNTEK